MTNVLESLKEKAPELVKENKGALIGALLGYLFTDSKQAQSTIMGAVAGSLLVDAKKESDTKES